MTHTIEGATELDSNVNPSGLIGGETYKARVNNIEPYGAFVTLREATAQIPEISGLVHKTELPGLVMPGELSVGQRVAVEFVERTDKGLSFRIPSTDHIDGDVSGGGVPAQTHASEAVQQAADGAGADSATRDALQQTNDELDALRARVDALEERLDSV